MPKTREEVIKEEIARMEKERKKKMMQSSPRSNTRDPAIILMTRILQQLNR